MNAAEENAQRSTLNVQPATEEAKASRGLSFIERLTFSPLPSSTP
jgi:hypothetical protein